MRDIAATSQSRPARSQIVRTVRAASTAAPDAHSTRPASRPDRPVRCATAGPGVPRTGGEGGRRT